LNAVEGKLKAIEAEGKEIGVKTKEARDAFLAVKKKRCVTVGGLVDGVAHRICADATSSTRHSTISRSASTRYTRI
jgi:hypothetical protein